MIEPGQCYDVPAAFCYGPWDWQYVPGAFFAVITLEHDPWRGEWACLVVEHGDVKAVPEEVLEKRRLA